MKPGQKTTEFIVTVAVVIATAADALKGSLPDKWAAIAAAIAVAGYAISRGLAKRGAGGGA
jgi:hypothetical protein